MLDYECNIPYRLELCGGWIDFPDVHKIYSGNVIDINIKPTYDFLPGGGMATSTRHTAFLLWYNNIPQGDKMQLAKTLFETELNFARSLTGTHDVIGIIYPGCNMIHYNNVDIWPDHVETLLDKESLQFLKDHVFLYEIQPRPPGFNPLENSCINYDDAVSLSRSSRLCWKAIQDKDVNALKEAINLCYEAQVHMFPATETKETKRIIPLLKKRNIACKLTGAGGGGYIVMIADEPIESAIRIEPTGLE